MLQPVPPRPADRRGSAHLPVLLLDLHGDLQVVAELPPAALTLRAGPRTRLLPEGARETAQHAHRLPAADTGDGAVRGGEIVRGGQTPLLWSERQWGDSQGRAGTSVRSGPEQRDGQGRARWRCGTVMELYIIALLRKCPSAVSQAGACGGKQEEDAISAPQSDRGIGG